MRNQTDQLMNRLLILKLEIKRATFFEGAAEGFDVQKAIEEYREGLVTLSRTVGYNSFQYNGDTYRIDYDMLYTLQLWQLL